MTDPTRPSRPDDQARQDAEALGVPPESLPDPTDDEESDVFEVWDINMPSVVLFLGCETQWRVVARGMQGLLYWLGIDYAAAAVLLRARPKREKKRYPAAQLLEDLRDMEIEARAIMNEVRD
ncbi:DUF1799 domain-containing protein [Mesorhizobium sp. M0965]|uniref:DUF1799 domain-containing protein n=1 Tax=unclassified Mesorhizobium TaxID=325217 RepID=UPI0033362FA5